LRGPVSQRRLYSVEFAVFYASAPLRARRICVPRCGISMARHGTAKQPLASRPVLK